MASDTVLEGIYGHFCMSCDGFFCSVVAHGQQTQLSSQPDTQQKHEL